MVDEVLDDLRHVNLAMHVCARHVLYTENGTLSEVLSVFTGYALAIHSWKDLGVDRSPKATLEWVLEACGIDNVYETNDRTAKIIAVFGSERQAISAMYDFANSLGPGFALPDETRI